MKQLSESWLRWPNSRSGASWAKIEMNKIRANSSQVGGQTIPNSIEVVNLAHVGLGCDDRLARAQRPLRIYSTF